jgi:hypothetical protein
MFVKDELVAAHRYCTNNRGQLDASNVAGCFYCKEIFAPGEVADWSMKEKRHFVRDAE